MSIATQLAVPSPASPDLYEHRGIVDLPENDTLAWLEESENEDPTDTRQVRAC